MHDLLRGCLAVVDLQYTEYLFLLFRCGYSGFGGGVLLGLGLGLALFLGTALIGVDEAVKSLAVMVGVVGDGLGVKIGAAVVGLGNGNAAVLVDLLHHSHMVAPNHHCAYLGLAAVLVIAALLVNAPPLAGVAVGDLGGFAVHLVYPAVGVGHAVGHTVAGLAVTVQLAVIIGVV